MASACKSKNGARLGQGLRAIPGDVIGQHRAKLFPGKLLLDPDLLDWSKEYLGISRDTNTAFAGDPCRVLPDSCNVEATLMEEVASQDGYFFRIAQVGASVLQALRKLLLHLWQGDEHAFVRAEHRIVEALRKDDRIRSCGKPRGRVDVNWCISWTDANRGI